jgi:hypothetical protein
MLSLMLAHLSLLLTPRAIDIRIACHTNYLDSPLSWQEREAVYAKLADLFYYKYVLTNVRSAEVRTLPDVYNCPAQLQSSGHWYLFQDF